LIAENILGFCAKVTRVIEFADHCLTKFTTEQPHGPRKRG
jgi:hypothetical protein